VFACLSLLDRSVISIRLDDRVDFADEPVAGEEAHRARHDKEERAQNQRVAKVQEKRHGAIDVQSREKINAAVDEHVQRRAARGQKRSPPPAIIFGN
jgi:hypothetical protein